MSDRKPCRTEGCPRTLAVLQQYASDRLAAHWSAYQGARAEREARA